VDHALRILMHTFLKAASAERINLKEKKGGFSLRSYGRKPSQALAPCRGEWSDARVVRPFCEMSTESQTRG
jgi:hypothetical protein